MPLTQAHYEEVGLFVGSDKFELSIEPYLKVEQLLRVFTMRVDGKLVGYCVFLVVPHSYYPSTIWAKQECLYVHPKHRGRRAAKFLIWCDEKLRKDGVDVVYRGVNVKNDYSAILERMGYESIERCYMRKLGLNQNGG